MNEKRYCRRMHLLLAGNVVFMLLLAFCALFWGRYSLSPKEVLQILASKLLGFAEKNAAVKVVWDIRLSRVILNIMVGAGLASAGCAYQSIFQNHLVSPDILGVSSGAGFGAALGLFLTSGTTMLVPVLAFAFGIGSVGLTCSIGKMKKDSSCLSMVLAGIVVSAIFNALISLIKLMADTDSVLPAITYWLMGSFSNTTFQECLLAGIPILLGLTVLFAMRWRMNILSMGDEEAKTLGVDPGKNRLLVILASTLVTAACVMVSGIIGWVGMVLPNICRVLAGADNRYLLPMSAITGASFMILVDFLARAASPGEIPVGILTALIGAPFFILVYRRLDGGHS